jgi:hypothetical protein
MVRQAHHDILFIVPCLYIKSGKHIHSILRSLQTSAILELQLLLAISQPHKAQYLIVQIIGQVHPKVMIKLILSRHLRHFCKAKIIGVLLLKSEHHMYKVFTQLRNPGNALMAVGYPYHGFGRLHRDVTNLMKPGCKIVKQHQRVLAFACQKFG